VQAVWRGIADGEVLFLLVLDSSSQATRTEMAVQQFLLTTSHDMRTPLNGIFMAAQARITHFSNILPSPV
jgi:signal transduction histidine kinase